MYYLEIAHNGAYIVVWEYIPDSDVLRYKCMLQNSGTSIPVKPGTTLNCDFHRDWMKHTFKSENLEDLYIEAALHVL